MRLHKIIKKRNLAASALLHFMLLLSFCLYFDTIPSSVREGQKSVNYIRSYLYQQPTQRPEPQPQEKKPVSIHKPIKPPIKTLLKTSVYKQQPTSFSESPQPLRTAEASRPQTLSQGEHTTELLALLHAAIQEKQQYPAAARQLRRGGRVKLGFILYPNGSISDLRLLKSSGTGSLDEAGLAAVRLAAPFSKVERYLQAATTYSIDVVFALNEEDE